MAWPPSGSKRPYPRRKAARCNRQGQVRLAAFPGEVLKARIVSILPQANRDTRTVRAA
jgi:hypothetical protein